MNSGLKKPNLNYLRVWDCKAAVRLPDLKLKTLGERGIECIFVGYAKNFQRFSSIPRPSQRSLVKGTKDSGGLIVSKKVTDEIVQQPELRKSKRQRNLKDFRPKFQLYLIKGTRNEISDQPSYCFNVEDDSKTFDEAMKSQDTAFLNGDLEDDVNMNQHLGFIMPGNENKVNLTKNFLSSRFFMKDIEEADVILGKLSRYTSNPGTQHWQAIQRVLKYLKKTMDYRLVYSGYTSVLEAAGKEAEWLKNLLLEIPLWVKPIAPIFICCDSTATLAKAYRKMYNGKSRHIGVRHSMICELITNGVVSIEFMRSQQNLADHLMKGMFRDLVIKSAEGMELKSN
nr:hypothetical protein [Tanacetum cinerariifolium]